MIAGRIGCRAIRDILTARNYKDTPPVHIKLTETREITPYLWVHPDEER
jgi:hypothetical protein